VADTNLPAESAPACLFDRNNRSYRTGATLVGNSTLDNFHAVLPSNAIAGIAIALQFGAEPDRELDGLYGPKTSEKIERFCGIKCPECG
jgi:hypothetical protein